VCVSYVKDVEGRFLLVMPTVLFLLFKIIVLNVRISLRTAYVRIAT